jgi:hypothetical protein
VASTGAAIFVILKPPALRASPIVLLVRVSAVSLKTILPLALGNSIILSAVGSTTVRVVSWSSAVAPSKTMLVPTPGVPVIVGLEIVGLVSIFCVRV